MSILFRTVVYISGYFRDINLETFLFSGAPKMIEMFYFVVDTIKNDHGEKSTVQCFVKGFEQAFTITFFQFGLVLVLGSLKGLTSIAVKHAAKHNTLEY